MPKKISQTSSAEGVDLRNLQTMICRVRENETRDPAVNHQILGRLLDLRQLYESIGYGSSKQLPIPGTVPSSPAPIEVTIPMPASSAPASVPMKKAANGGARRARA